MRTPRRGFTIVEFFLLIAAIVMLLLLGGLAWGGVVLWNRVAQLNSWAVATDTWLSDKLYPWIRDNTFNGGGNPDGNKPPEPPGGL